MEWGESRNRTLAAGVQQLECLRGLIAMEEQPTLGPTEARAHSEITTVTVTLGNGSARLGVQRSVVKYAEAAGDSRSK